MLGAAVSAANAAPSEVQLAVNPSLEQDANKDRVPDCWQVGGYGSNTASAQQTSDSHSGKVAERISISKYTDGNRKLVTSQDSGACAPKANPGATYTVSAWRKSTVASEFSLYYRDAQGVWTYWVNSPVVPASAKWGKVSFTTPPLPAGATHLSFGLSIAGVGSLTTDDYSLVEATSPAPVTPTPTPTPVTPSTGSSPSAAAGVSKYATAVLADRPAAFLQGTKDLTGNGHTGKALANPSTATLPNGDPATAFNGRDQYLEFADSDVFSVTTSGVLTAEYWVRPDTLQHSSQEGTGYVNFLGKGAPGEYEWYGRMYSKQNQENRPNRISGYVFNPTGGLGSGSYFQDAVKTGEWIHVALVINTKDKSSAYPMGYTKIYKNGVLRDQDSLKDYNVVPRNGKEPLRVGTATRNSFLQGAIGNVGIYNQELPADRILAHYKAM